MRSRLTVLAASAVVASAFSVAACRPTVGTTAPRVPGVATAPSRNDPFLDTVQVRTFQWFWDVTDARTGLTPDRWPKRTFSSVAAVGFALSSYVVGAERAYVTRPQAAERTLATLRFLWTLPQGPGAKGVGGYNGFYYHFLHFEDGTRFETVELSSIDTALLLAGVLSCQQYFDGAAGDEAAIRAYADSIYRRVDWRWFRARPPAIALGWSPESGFLGYDWKGYDEAMLVYILALGSPTHAIEPDAWDVWTSTYRSASYYGQAHVNFPPLFGHQYTHTWIDFRGIRDSYMRDRGIDYFENSRRATIAQRSYAMDNPMRWRGYGADVWGLTASDGPKDTTIVYEGTPRRFYSYAARGAAATEVRDDGTIAPTAAGGSVPFAPEIAIPALKAMRVRHGDDLFTRYGFVDAFNTSYFAGPTADGHVVPGKGWFDTDYLGIDQGPILLMIENYRSELLWRLMRESPYVRRGLTRAGFTGGWLDQRPANR